MGCTLQDPRSGRTHLALVMVLVASSAALPAVGPGDGELVQFMVKRQLIEARIVKQDDSGFTFRMKIGRELESGDMWLPWSALSPVDVKRIRTRKATSDLDTLPARGGDPVQATRYHFTNSRVIVGLEISEKSTPEEVVIRARHAPEFRIPRKDIERTESVTLAETDFYTREEIYQRTKAKMNPQSARDHFRLGERMARIGHWARAKEHFEKAAAPEQGLKEAAERRAGEMGAALLDAEARRLDRQIAADIRAERWFEAVQKIRTLAALVPNSPIRTKWEAQLPRLVRELRKSLQRSIVRSYYETMDDLLRKWVSGRRPVGGGIPGVRVTVDGRESVTGKVVEKNPEVLVIENEGRRIEIARHKITNETPIDLSPVRAAPGFADSKSYIEDAAGGITGDILTELEEKYREFGTPQLTIDRKLIEGFWKERLVAVIKWDDRGKRQELPAFSYHEANWGPGTWLREGAPAAGPAAPGGSSVQTDPERWWKSRPFQVRYQVLRAMAAEALCKVDKVMTPRCPACGGAGGDGVVGPGTGPGRLTTRTRACPTCRGSGSFIKLRYR